jgi:hypothetical protein
LFIGNIEDRLCDICHVRLYHSSDNR